MLSVPEISFIEQGRALEVEAIDGGCRTNEFSTSPTTALSGDDCSVALISTDDIQETEERVADLQKYVPHAEKAFTERRLKYPFRVSNDKASLKPIPGQQELARACAKLSSVVGVGQKEAKEFELRAFRALHKLIGGWAVCVGAPRSDHTGCRRAVENFRKLLYSSELGSYENPAPRSSGDYKMDGVWILGREWGGPLAFLQVKNSLFDPEKFGADLLVMSDSLNEWFGRRMDEYRAVITVCAVNTVFTTELKERAFRAGKLYHLLDSVDILHAEARDELFTHLRDKRQEF